MRSALPIFVRTAVFVFFFAASAVRTTLYVEEAQLREAVKAHEAALPAFGPVVLRAAHAVELAIHRGAARLSFPVRSPGEAIGFSRTRIDPDAPDPFDRFFGKALRASWFARARALASLFVKRISLLAALLGVTAFLWGAVVIDAVYVRKCRALEDGRSNALLLAASAAALRFFFPAAALLMLSPGGWCAWASAAAAAAWAGLLWIWLANTRRFD
mgnify:FL=1